MKSGVVVFFASKLIWPSNGHKLKPLGLQEGFEENLKKKRERSNWPTLVFPELIMHVLRCNPEYGSLDFLPACGNVLDQAPYDGCYIYTGQKTECIIFWKRGSVFRNDLLFTGIIIILLIWKYKNEFIIHLNSNLIERLFNRNSVWNLIIHYLVYSFPPGHVLAINAAQHSSWIG